MTLARLLLAAAVILAWTPPGALATTWTELRFTPEGPSDLVRLRALGVDLRRAGDDAPPGSVSVFVPRHRLAEVLAIGAPVRVVHDDVAAFYAARLAAPVEERRPAEGRARLGTGSMGGYFTFTEAVAEMDALAAAYPALVAPKVSLGQSHEGRDIWAWKLSANPLVDEDEPEVVDLALMHAREPAGMMSLVYLAERLLGGYGSDPEATYLLDHRELWLVPVLNPDGYVHNESTNPAGGGMWRKNRRDNGDGTFGVDLNRNWGYEWGYDDQGSSPNTDSGVYRGTMAFSEPESRALSAHIIARSAQVSVNTHCFGDLLIRPWAYIDAYTPEEAEYRDISEVANRATAYIHGNAQDTVRYVANGDHDAWVYGEQAAKPRGFGFTPELGSGDDGFWPATFRIQPIAEEAYTVHTSLLWAGGPWPKLAAVRVDDSAAGDGDGVPEPGETVALLVDLKNHGTRPTWGALTAELVSPLCEVTVVDPTSGYGPVDWQATAGNAADPFLIRIGAGTAGQVVSLTLRLADDRGPYPDLNVELLLGEPTVLFSDDLESGTAGWRLVGWEQEPAGGTGTGMALSDSAGGRYVNDDEEWATIDQRLDLQGAAHAYVKFRQRFWVDNDFDAAFVEVSTDGRRTYTALRGLSTGVGSGFGVQPADAPLYDGYLPDWRDEWVDLSAYTGPGMSNVYVRFRLETNGSIRYDGWLIDDVEVLAFPPTAPLSVPDDPLPLKAVRAGADVDLVWPPAFAADGYVVERSAVVQASSGFAPLTSGLGTTTVDVDAVNAATSYAYQVVATNCAGPSSDPP